MGRRQLLIDFGARRAQDRGAIAGVRGALIGGADFSSNVGISHVLGGCLVLCPYGQELHGDEDSHHEPQSPLLPSGIRSGGQLHCPMPCVALRNSWWYDR